MLDRAWILNETRAALRHLAMPWPEQLKYLREIGGNLGQLPVEELALEFDDIASAALGLGEEGWLDSAQTAALQAVAERLGAMSAPESKWLWNERALALAREWAEVRELATKALRLVGDPEPNWPIGKRIRAGREHPAT